MNFLYFIPLFYISHPRLHSNKNWREPRALNLRNPGRPVYDLYEKNQDFLVAQEQKLGAKGHWALLEYSPVISPQFATLLFFSFVFHSTVLYLSSLLISLPYSLFLLSFILLFYVLSPLRLRCRGNLTPVSNVCEGAPRSLVGPPRDATNDRKCVSNFPSTWLANRQWHFKQANHDTCSIPGTQLGTQNKDFGAVSQTVLTRV